MVEKYNAKIKDNKNVEMIYVSRDRSEDAMEAFMAEYEMPWPAIDFDKMEKWKLAWEIYGRAVPFYALVNAEGEVMAKGSGAVFAAIDQLKLDEEEG